MQLKNEVFLIDRKCFQFDQNFGSYQTQKKKKKKIEKTD
jgi:hypothetical protein